MTSGPVRLRRAWRGTHTTSTSRLAQPRCLPSLPTRVVDPGAMHARASQAPPTRVPDPGAAPAHTSLSADSSRTSSIPKKRSHQRCTDDRDNEARGSKRLASRTQCTSRASTTSRDPAKCTTTSYCRPRTRPEARPTSRHHEFTGWTTWGSCTRPLTMLPTTPAKATTQLQQLQQANERGYRCQQFWLELCVRSMMHSPPPGARLKDTLVGARAPTALARTHAFVP